MKPLPVGLAAATPTALEPRLAASDVVSSPPPADADTYVPGPASAPEAAPVPDDAEAKEKDRLIREMIRQAPDEASRGEVVAALSAYPVRALQVVHDYGTRIEIYDFQAGEAVPEYLPTLSYANVAGAYNSKANVLGTDRANASPFALIHEFAHALDAALNDVSNRGEWNGAYTLARNTNRVVRDYAKQDASEYLAEITTAYLIPDERLLPLVEQGLARGAHGMEEREFMRMHQSLSNGSLHRIDPDGYALVDDLIKHDIYEDKPRAPSPAMTAEEWHAFEVARRASEA